MALPDQLADLERKVSVRFSAALAEIRQEMREELLTVPDARVSFLDFQGQAGLHFDPDLVPVFLSLREQLETIRQRWKDEAPEPVIADCLG